MLKSIKDARKENKRCPQIVDNAIETVDISVYKSAVMLTFLPLKQLRLPSEILRHVRNDIVHSARFPLV